MRSIFRICLLLSAFAAAFAQDNDPAESREDILCKEVAQDVINIYRNWSPKRDFDILYPRVKGYVDDFYSDYPDFNDEIIRKDKVDEPLNDYEKRALVAYKALKTDLIFEEVARFITTKDFYWGYIPDSLDKQISLAAQKVKDHINSKETELLQGQEKLVSELLEETRRIETELSEMNNITDLDVVNELLNDEQYNNEMFQFHTRLDSLKKNEGREEIISGLIKENYDRIEYYINKKKKDLITQKREEYISTREYWIEMKRITLFDLKEEESYRLSDLISEAQIPMVEELGIESFDVSDELIKKIGTNDPEAEDEFIFQIKNKFYSGLTSTFGTYVLYDDIPVFRTFRMNVLIGTLMFMILFFYVFIQVKKSREAMYIRKIPGLDAIDDAVGRATEMGKPIVYDSGLGGYTHIDTIASMLILKSIAKKVAEFKAEIYVPTCDPIILQISEEMVASGFLDAGYPEDHKKDNIFFIAYDQFAFAAGVAGILSRKKPATAFHFGYYYAESLLISEAGFTAGAIQVAGTTAVSQLPFFITSCDYTLMGEELYAAAAYISRDPQILTNLKLSDYAKVAIGILFIIGTILLTINSEWTFLQDLIHTR
ncbi:MAG TPA: hypothetical protein PKW56_03830 [Clostridiales bacterium]|nr:hypothetical protein [Clostridiales bacterium]